MLHLLMAVDPQDLNPPTTPVSWTDGLTAVREYCRRQRAASSQGSRYDCLRDAFRQALGEDKLLARGAIKGLLRPMPGERQPEAQAQASDTPEWVTHPLRDPPVGIRTLWNLWQTLSRAVQYGELEGGGMFDKQGRPTAESLLHDVVNQEHTWMVHRSVRLIMDEISVQGRLGENSLIHTPFWLHPWIDHEPKVGGFGQDTPEHLEAWTQGLRGALTEQKPPTNVSLDVLASLLLVAKPSLRTGSTGIEDGRDRMSLWAHPFVEVHGEALMDAIGRILRQPSAQIDQGEAVLLLTQSSQGIFQTLIQRPGGWDDKNTWLFWKRVRNDISQAMSAFLLEEKVRREKADGLCCRAMPEGLPSRDRWLLSHSSLPGSAAGRPRRTL